MTENQYIVPVLREAEDTWSKIAMLTQPLSCLYDQHGNLQNCGFGRVRNERLGEFYVFQSLDRKVAEIVRQELLRNPELKVMPIREVQYQKK